MPRVLRIINRLNLGGPTFNVALLTRYLPSDFTTKLVAGEKDHSEESSDFIVKDLGLEYTKIAEMHRSIHPLKDWKAYRQLVKIIREFKPDIVHTHAAKAGTLGRLAAFQEKVPVVVHTFHGHVFHSYFSPMKTRVFLGIERYLAKRSSGIIAISDKQKSELVQKYRVCDLKKVRVIPLGFDLSRFQEKQAEKRLAFREKYKIAEDEIAIGIIGRLVPVKNQAMFLKCAAALKNACGGKLRFLLIGDGEDRMHLLQLAKELGLEFNYFPENQEKSYVTFCSWIHEIDEVVAGLDIVTLASFNEGTPVSLIEAQAGNRVVVSTNVGGIENVVDVDRSAFLVASGDLEAFTGKVKLLCEDAALRSQMSARGWELVRERFHYTRLIKDMDTYYRELLEKARKKGKRA